ncbi:hypothetical protein [Actinomadura macrotermitis]|uniref:Uncharacterized protein n=1 Tax=Actinomadura macrotermitis TaxID=2585200 RepID=A0A7K0BRD2_9ACTN|nr:hypothetical protein [Actinomadura macrotermitis]MQY03753.1 hypothetical protein [Actinomadura macrotermitis]
MRVRLVRPSSYGGRPSPRTLRAPVAFVGALLLVSGLAACGQERSGNGAFKPSGGDEDTAAAAPAGTAPSQAGAPSAQPTAQVNETVLERYRAYQAMYKRVYEINDASELATVAADPLLSEVTKDVERTKAKGEIWRFTNVSNPRIYARAKDGQTVFIVDCLRTLAGYRFSAKTGKRTGGGSGDAYLYRVAVKYDAGAWKVSDAVRDKKC